MKFPMNEIEIETKAGPMFYGKGYLGPPDPHVALPHPTPAPS